MMSILDEIVTFGKYKGKLWREVDMSYLNWIIYEGNQEDIRKIAYKVIAERHEEYAEFENKNNITITFSENTSKLNESNAAFFKELRISIDDLEKAANSGSEQLQLSIINDIQDQLLEYKEINSLNKNNDESSIIIEFHDS